MVLSKPTVAFVCVHNSARSQIAEALGKYFAADVFTAYSAGTEQRESINEDAVAVVKELYGLDMTASQKPKLLAALPPKLDIVVVMGCGAVCPSLQARYHEDWGLDDPSGKSHEEFVKTAGLIESKVKELAAKITAGAYG